MKQQSFQNMVNTVFGLLPHYRRVFVISKNRKNKFIFYFFLFAASYNITRWPHNMCAGYIIKLNFKPVLYNRNTISSLETVPSSSLCRYFELMKISRQFYFDNYIQRIQLRFNNKRVMKYE